MAEIKLFDIKDKVEELPSKQVTLEKELQNLLEKNMNTFFGVTFLKSSPNLRYLTSLMFLCI